MKKVRFEKDLNVLANLLQNNHLSTDQCNQLYVDAIRKQSIGELVPTLKLLSPYCASIKNIPSELSGEKYFEAIKFILKDNKYANYDWIVKFLKFDDGSTVNKSEILKFILNGVFEPNLFRSITSVVVVYNYFYDVEVLLEFIDKIDLEWLNRSDKFEGSVVSDTIIHDLITEPFGNSAAVLERVISNGYDVDTPLIVANGRGKNKTTTTVPTLKLFFNSLLLRIEYGDGNIADEDTKRVSRPLLKHSTLTKETIDEIIVSFDEMDEKMTITDESGQKIGWSSWFFLYLNDVFGDGADSPPFFFENYPNEITTNHCYNLLPKEVRDIFVF